MTLSYVESALSDVVAGHVNRSCLFKPKISFIYGGEKILQAGDFTMLEGKTPYISLRVISDGRRALIKRVSVDNPIISENKQP